MFAASNNGGRSYDADLWRFWEDCNTADSSVAAAIAGSVEVVDYESSCS